MSEDNKTKFGNMPLGMINKMLVSFIGEDAFLDYCEKYHKDWKLDWQSREAFRKHLDRLFEEKESSYRDLNPHYEQSVYRIAWKILDDFCKEYDLPKYISYTIQSFYGLLMVRLSRTEYPVFETCYMLDFVICGTLHFFVEQTVSEIRKSHDIRFSYLDAETKYNMVFDELGRQFKSLENFYTKLSEHLWDSPTSTWYKDWYKESYKQRYEKRYKEMHKEKWKKKLDEKINNKLDWKDCLRLHFKDIVIYNCKKGQNPTQWNDMKAILDFCKKEGKEKEMSRLIEAYITANVQNAIQKEIPPEKKDWNEIKSCLEDIITYLNENYLILPADLSDKLHQRVEMLHHILLDPLGDKSKPIELACLEILENHIYLQDEKRAEDLISNIKEIAPEASGFYCNWLLAYIAVAKGEFEIAKKFYKAAFDNIHFAGILTEPFLKQAFALSVYCDANSDTVRKAIDPEENSKTPLSPSGKRFLEYGYAIEIGVFNKPVEESYRELVSWREKFCDEFPEDMFFPGIEVDFNRKLAPIGSFAASNGNIKEKIEEDYNSLCKLKKDSINTRMVNFQNRGLQRRPPISVAMWLFSISSNEGFIDLEERSLDLIEGWLGLSCSEKAIKELDLNAIADLGETPLNTATMVFKDFCAKHSDPESPVKKRLRKIVIHILGKTDKDHMGIDTKRKRIHALQNVIDSCDIDLVKEFVKKFIEVKLDIESIRFTPNKVSPIHYIIDRILNLQHSQENTSGEQIEKLKEICLYLIDHTKNQDAYKCRNNHGTEWTILTLASETDDIDICRALLKHGADPNISLKTGWDNEIPNTFLHRCIEYEAWKVLEMFLTDFKDKAAETIKKYNNSGKYAPFVFFFEKNKEKRTGFMEKFIKLFESCGADFTINSADELKKQP